MKIPFKFGAPSLAAISIVAITTFTVLASGPGAAPTGGNVNATFNSVSGGTGVPAGAGYGGDFSGTTAGVNGTSTAVNGAGVSGSSGANTGVGVRGTTTNNGGFGVIGSVSGASAGGATGIYGQVAAGSPTTANAGTFANQVSNIFASLATNTDAVVANGRSDLNGDIRNTSATNGGVVTISDTDGFAVTVPTAPVRFKVNGSDGSISNPVAGEPVVIGDADGLKSFAPGGGYASIGGDFQGVFGGVRAYSSGVGSVGGDFTSAAVGAKGTSTSATGGTGGAFFANGFGIISATGSVSTGIAGRFSNSSASTPNVNIGAATYSLGVQPDAGGNNYFQLDNTGRLSNPSSSNYGHVYIDDAAEIDVDLGNAFEVYSYDDTTNTWPTAYFGSYDYDTGAAIWADGGRTGIYATANGGSSGIDTAVLADGGDYGVRAWGDKGGVQAHGYWNVPGSYGLLADGVTGVSATSTTAVNGTGVGVFGASSQYATGGVGVDGRGVNASVGVRGKGIGAGSEGAQFIYNSVVGGAALNQVDLATSSMAILANGKAQVNATGLSNNSGLEVDASGTWAKGVTGNATGYSSIGVAGSGEIGVSGGGTSSGVSGYGPTGVNGTASSSSSGQGGLFMNGLYYAKLSTPSASIEADGPIRAKSFGRIYTASGSSVSLGANTYGSIGSASCSNSGDRVLSCSLSASSNVLLADTYPGSTSCSVWARNVGGVSMSATPKVTCIDPNGSPW